MSDVINSTQNVIPPAPLPQAKIPVVNTSPTSYKIPIIVVLTFLLLISIVLNVTQFSLFTFKDLTAKYPRNFAINPDNPKLLKFGMTYYLEGQIKQVKKEGNTLELITDIENLPKVYVEGNTNILTKRGSEYSTSDRDQIVAGKKVNLLLFNSNMEKWFLSRVVILN